MEIGLVLRRGVQKQLWSSLETVQADRREETFQPSLALPLRCAVAPAGTLLFLSLALFTFTRESHRCLPQLTQSHGVLMVTLKRLLSPGFLACLAQT